MSLKSKNLNPVFYFAESKRTYSSNFYANYSKERFQSSWSRIFSRSNIIKNRGVSCPPMSTVFRRKDRMAKAIPLVSLTESAPLEPVQKLYYYNYTNFNYAKVTICGLIRLDLNKTKENLDHFIGVCPDKAHLFTNP